MSSKVDNIGIYTNLNDQHVRELLSNHIPQDEAKLLSNGRLTCLICIHRPIFDTINMLSIHRKSKRHLQELSKHIKYKEDAIIRELQRKNNFNNKEENKPIFKTKLFPSSLRNRPMLGSKLAEARSLNTFGRKPTLEIKPKLPSKLKTIEKPKDSKNGNVTVRNYLKTMTRKSSIDKVVEWSRDNYGQDLQKPNIEGGSISEEKTTVELRAKNSKHNSGNEGPATITSSQSYELKLRMSGWIKSKDGNWIKDPDVEFDSDDEVPPPPS